MPNKLVFRSTAAGAEALGLYNPPATDAVLINPDGTVNGPANPELFSSDAEAHALLSDLIQSGIVKKKAKFHHIIDEPESEDFSVRYGSDGRKILVLVIRRDGQHLANNVQELYIEWKRLTSPGWHWAIAVSEGVDYLIRTGGTP